MPKPQIQSHVIHGEPSATDRQTRRENPQLSLGSDRVDIDQQDYAQVALIGEFSKQPSIALTVGRAYSPGTAHATNKQGAVDTTAVLDARAAHALAAAIEKRACQLDEIAINRAEVGKRQRESAGFNPDEPEAVGLF